MPSSIAEQTILLDLPIHNATDLLLEPMVKYDNILQSRMPVYEFMYGKDKHKFLHLVDPKYNLQPKTNCDTWNPTGGFTMRPEEIVVSDWELNMQQCKDEFDEGCLRNLRPDGGQNPINSTTPALNALEAAMLMSIRRQLGNDIFRVAHFGRKDIADLISDGSITLTSLTPEERVRFTAMMGVADGWWAELEARTLTSIQSARVAYVDSNDGTYVGNATVPANAPDFLKQLASSSDPVLRMWKYQNPSATARPKYLVQSGIFNAYKSYLQGLGVESSFTLVVNGETIPGVLVYDGYLVIEMPEWDMYDIETGNYNFTTGLSKIQRALFIADGNLAGLLNARPVSGFENSALIVQRSPLLKDKGKTYIYADMGMGFGIVQPKLVTVSYNSSQTFDVTP